MEQKDGFALQDALQAQQALRSAAGLEPERFPVNEFVGMISDEIEHLRKSGRSDADIAALIAQGSTIRVTPEEIARYYATPDQRVGHGG